MIYLNLISEEIKNKIRFKNLYETIKYSSVFLLIFVFFVSGLFFIASMILENNYSNIKNNYLTKINQEDSRVYEVNNMIIALEDVQNNFYPWSIFLEDISNSANSGIFFSRIKIDKGERFVVMEGEADNRSNLIDFKNNLQNLEKIVSFEFFNYDIFQKENIVFNIKAKF